MIRDTVSCKSKSGWFSQLRLRLRLRLLDVGQAQWILILNTNTRDELVVVGEPCISKC